MKGTAQSSEQKQISSKIREHLRICKAKYLTEKEDVCMDIFASYESKLTACTEAYLILNSQVIFAPRNAFKTILIVILPKTGH